MNNSKSDFTQGSISKKLIAFMVPILGALVLQAAYGAVDLLVVGRFGTTSRLSAVSTGSQVLNLVTFIITQLAMGITVLTAIFRELGDSRSPLIFVAVACVINVICDFVLVAGLHMDAAGAAAATVFAQAVSVVLALFLLVKKKLPFIIVREDFRLNSQCRRVFKIGFPLALQECLTQISFLALCAFVNRLGLEAWYVSL